MRMGGFHRALHHDVPAKRPSVRRVLRHFWPFLRQRKWAVILGTTCVWVGLLFGKINPLIVRYLMDSVFTPVREGRLAYNMALSRLLWASGAMFAATLATALIIRFRMRMMRQAGASMVRDIRQHVYAHLQKLSLRFYDSRQTGDIMSRITGDIGALERLITQVSDRVLGDVLNIVVTLLIVFVLDWRLALVALLPVPVLLRLMVWFSRTIRPVFREVRDRMGHLHARLQDNISGIRVIKAFHTEETEAERFGSANDRFYAKQMEEVKLSSTAFPMIRFVDSMGYVLVMAVGGFWLIQPDSRLTVGDLFAFSIYALQLYQPIGGLFHMYSSVLQSLASGERVAELLEEEPDIRDATDAAELPAVRGRVVFQNVDFHYQSGVDVLKDIDFAVEPGQTVALVGPSGTGKTSLVNLILRFYDPVTGRVTIDGYDLRRVTQQSLRRQIAVVLQDVFLFNGTVLDNICYALPEAELPAVMAAARSANAEAFILRLADGYDTEIGERGVKLSGGQKQRIAIARALLADRPILILDEATSMVDTEGELLIQDALKRLMQDRTTFVIAHRLSTIMHADRILVIEDGCITESGRHDDLYAADGAYRRMFDAQFRF